MRHAHRGPRDAADAIGEAEWRAAEIEAGRDPDRDDEGPDPDQARDDARDKADDERERERDGF